MFTERCQRVERHLRQFIREHFQVDLPSLAREIPPSPELGDLAFPFPFELARKLRRAPRQIAQEVAEGIPPLAEVRLFQAAGAGYLNVFFQRSLFFRDLYRWVSDPFPSPAGEKVIVEHTNINPNKAAHIGHLRNAVLGDTFVRLLRACGRVVEVQNYIDNTGVQVADVVVGFQQLRGLTLEEVERLPEPFDYYCWDLYAEVSDWFRQDESRLQYRHKALQEIEEGEGETARLAEHISERIVRAHLKTMDRLGIRYDVLPRESEILRLKFWEEAFQRLQQAGAVVFMAQGPHRGCWVMRLPEEENQAQEEKIIVRSNGTVTYVGKDIAYQLWKFGLLSKTFHYRPFYRYEEGHVAWVSHTEAHPEEPDFGRGRRVYNVIDVRQSYPQRVVVEGLRKLGYQEQADNSIHFSYEMVALSPACCRELGIELDPEDLSKPYVEVSGRKGLGVKADDLIDKLLEKSLAEVQSRQPELPLSQQQYLARQIAVAALRYFLLKYTRNAVIAFDFAEALSFEGETGPYLQYSLVRANNILRKLSHREAGSLWPPGQSPLWSDSGFREEWLEEPEIWNLLSLAGRTGEVVQQSVQNLEMSHLAKHAFTLAQQFNLFYHKYHILSEQDLSKRIFYLTVLETTRSILLRTLALLGIEVPERM